MVALGATSLLRSLPTPSSSRRRTAAPDRDLVNPRAVRIDHRSVAQVGAIERGLAFLRGLACRVVFDRRLLPCQGSS